MGGVGVDGRLQNRRSPQCGSGGMPHGKLRHWSETEKRKGGTAAAE